MLFRGEEWKVIVPDTSKMSKFPEAMCFRTNAAATLKTFHSIRSNLNRFTGEKLWLKPDLNPQKSVKIESYIAMEKVTKISTSAALVLAAEYERKTKNMDESPPIFNLKKWDSELLHKLKQIGFFERFGYDLTKDTQPKSDGDVLTVPFYSGTKLEMEKYDSKLRDLVRHIDPEYVLPKQMKLALNSAVGEAATNAREHAYIANHKYQYPPVGLWWATGAALKKERKIVISLFDQGISIPISYPKLPIFSKLQSTLGLFDQSSKSPFINDAKLIQAATIYGKTGRKRASHSTQSIFSDKKVGGLGLPQIKDAIDLCGVGSLMILSRGGRYLYTVDNRKAEEKLDNFEYSIGGTLIEWAVVVPNLVT